MKDCIGRCVRYCYDGDLLTEVELVNGGVETYQYDAKGRVIEITDANGNTYVHNEYDSADFYQYESPHENRSRKHEKRYKEV